MSRGIVPGHGVNRVRRARRLLAESNAGAERARGIAVGAGAGAWEAALAPPVAAGVLEGAALADLRRLARRLERLRAMAPAIAERVELSEQAESLIAGSAAVEPPRSASMGRVIPFRRLSGRGAVRECSGVWLAD